MVAVNACKKAIGLSLIELMVSMLLGIIVIGGAVAIYMSTIQSSSDTVKSARLNYDLDSAMQLMINDIRRAGYWGGGDVESDATANPFMQAGVDIQISKKTGEADNSCILYTYDSDGDGVVGLDEYYGFRLNNEGLDVRFSVSDIGSTSCDDRNWGSVVNTENIAISSLTFSDANYKCLNVTTAVSYNSSCAVVIAAGNLVAGERAVETRQIDISLEGRVVNDADNTQKALVGVVTVRNNRVL